MMNLDNLNYLKEKIDSGDALSQKMKSIVADLIEKEVDRISDSTDSFIHFYEDVIQKELTVIFKEIISEPDYCNSSEHAKVCLSLCPAFSELPRNAKVGAWLSDALKFVDYLILHFIQEIREDIIDPNDYVGEKSILREERRRYDKLRSYEQPISNLGSWLDDLYMQRNRIQHNTTVNKSSGKHTLKLPRYNHIQKAVTKKYPEILNLIEHIYIS